MSKTKYSTLISSKSDLRVEGYISDEILEFHTLRVLLLLSAFLVLEQCKYTKHNFKNETPKFIVS